MFSKKINFICTNCEKADWHWKENNINLLCLNCREDIWKEKQKVERLNKIEKIKNDIMSGKICRYKEHNFTSAYNPNIEMVLWYCSQCGIDKDYLN